MGKRPSYLEAGNLIKPADSIGKAFGFPPEAFLHSELQPGEKGVRAEVEYRGHLPVLLAYADYSHVSGLSVSGNIVSTAFLTFSQTSSLVSTPDSRLALFKKASILRLSLTIFTAATSSR